MKKLVNTIFADNPGESVVFMTEDKQAFFDELLAKNHAKRNDFEEPETFYREGHEPVDVQPLVDELELVKEDNETMRTILGQIENASNLDIAIPAVNHETDPVVSAVIQLRETHEASVKLVKLVTQALAEGTQVGAETHPIVAEIINLKQSFTDLKSELEGLKSLSVTSENVTDQTAKNTVVPVKEAVTSDKKVTK